MLQGEYVTGVKVNTLRQYHLLVARTLEGFGWQIRYGRRAKPSAVSDRTYPTIKEATAAGEDALAQLRSYDGTIASD